MELDGIPVILKNSFRNTLGIFTIILFRITSGYWLWLLRNEPIVNSFFDCIEQLEEIVLERLEALMKQPEFISRLTCFHW